MFPELLTLGPHQDLVADISHKDLPARGASAGRHEDTNNFFSSRTR